MRPLLVGVCTPCLLAVALAAGQVYGQCEEWLPGTGVPGISGQVNAAVMWDRDGEGPDPAVLVVGGAFTLADSTLVNNIALWDGTSWSAMGDGLGKNTGVTATSTQVNALTVYDGTVIAGGTFTNSGATTLGRIARWNPGTSTWSRLNSGTTIDFGAAAVNALVVASNGNLIAGGSFTTAGDNAAGTITVNRIASWNGTAWGVINPTGVVPGVNNTVNALAVAKNNDLLAGGTFTTAGRATTGSVTVNRIARWTWDGTDWNAAALGSGINLGITVNAIAVDGVTGDIIVGGNFFQYSRGVARWTDATSTWGPLGPDLTVNTPGVNAVAIMPNGDIYAGGGIITAGPTGSKVSINSFARFNGANWVAADAGEVPRNVNCLLVRDDGSLVVGGAIKEMDNVPADGVVVLNGSTWSAITSGNPATNAPVTTLKALSNGNLYAGGSFLSLDGAAARRVAQWGGSVWSAMGNGLFREPAPNVYTGQPTQSVPISSFALMPSGNVAVAGHADLRTTNGGGQADAAIAAQWNGSSWSTFSPTLTGGDFGFTDPFKFNGYTLDAVVLPAGIYAGQLVVTGRFFFSGDPTTEHYMARWDGTQWVDMGPGGYLLVKPNGHVFLGGGFTNLYFDPELNYLVEWDGTTLSGGLPDWKPVGAGPGGAVRAMALANNGDLIVGGDFTAVGNRVARWDGSAWHNMGSGMSGPVNAIAVMPNGDIIVGGEFHDAVSVVGEPTTPACNLIARWNGTSWSAMGDGLGTVGNSTANATGTISSNAGVVNALAVASDGTLFVGGNFATAGGNVSAYIARWGCPVSACPADFNGVNGVTVQDIFDFLTAWLAGSPTADFNGVNGVTVQDIFDFLTAWLAGC